MTAPPSIIRMYLKHCKAASQRDHPPLISTLHASTLSRSSVVRHDGPKSPVCLFVRWRGRHERIVPEKGRIVADPLCDKKGGGCRGKVLKMDGCSREGDAFTLHSFTCSQAFPCKVSMWVLGSPWQGFSDGFPGNHIWTAAGDSSEKGLHKKLPLTEGKWSHVEYVFPRQQSEFTWREGAEAASGERISRVRVMVEAKDDGESTYPKTAKSSTINHKPWPGTMDDLPTINFDPGPWTLNPLLRI